MATIRQNGTAQIRTNFTEQELRSGSWNAPDEWLLSDATLDVLQYLREWSGEPITVTSTLRTPEHQALLGGSSTSRHISGNAIDFKWTDPEVHKEMVSRMRDALRCGDLEQGAHPADLFLWPTIYQLMGTLEDSKGGGIGWYETFVHIDDRGQDQDNAVMWDNSNNAFDDYYMDSQFYADAYMMDLCDQLPRDGKKKPGLVRIFESIFGKFPRYAEDGALSYINRLIRWVVIALAAFVASIIYKRRK